MLSRLKWQMRLTRWVVGHGPDSVRSPFERAARSRFADREVTAATRRTDRPLALAQVLRQTQIETKGLPGVEVKIGVTDSPRELSFNSSQTPIEVEKLVTDALTKESGVLSLTDEKGRRFLVQTGRIAYVEIGAADIRRVGFGVGSDSAKTG
jgi:hypothetical protein